MYQFHPPLMKDAVGKFEIEMLEYAAYMYLRALSFNNILDILRAWYMKDVLSKRSLITHIELLADRIPDNSTISQIFKPKRSGYYALDGTWMKYCGKDIVLLIIFDVQTLDLVGWRVASFEDEDSYTALIASVHDEIAASARGFFCDGDPGLLKAVRAKFPVTPIQLCIFHKYSRVGQIIPFVHPRTEIDREIKLRTEKVLFASTKQSAISALDELMAYAREHDGHKKLKEVIGVLNRNFELLLTHFDNPEMSPYNNVLEGFNHIVKRKTKLMKGFKKSQNINRWLKLILTDWRFHILRESSFKERRGKSPLQLAGVDLPKVHNWMTFLRTRPERKPY
jgi:hypothetical protein